MEDAGHSLPGTARQQREFFGARGTAQKKEVERQVRYIHSAQVEDNGGCGGLFSMILQMTKIVTGKPWSKRKPAFSGLKSGHSRPQFHGSSDSVNFRAVMIISHRRANILKELAFSLPRYVLHHTLPISNPSTTKRSVFRV